MITNQQQLENAGMSCLRRETSPPRIDPRLKASAALKAQGPKSRINPSLRLKARTVMQREADARQDARDYQNTLVYTKSEYKDTSAHWVQRPPAPLVRGKRAQEEIKAARENLTHNLPQEVSRRRRRLKVKLQTPPRSLKISREYARAIVQSLMEEVKPL